MGNKYADKSMIRDNPNYEEIQRINNQKIDHSSKVQHAKCLTCKHGCVDFEYNVKGCCNNYSPRMTLNKINYEITMQKINLHKLCKKYNLHYYTLQSILHNKMVMTFKYYFALEQRILEKDEWLEYLDSHNPSFNGGF